MSYFSLRLLTCGFFMCFSVSLVSCKKPEVAYYEVPREESKLPESALPANHPQVPPSPGGGQNMSDPAMANLIPAPSIDSGSGLNWSTADHWVAGRSSSMRLGSYTLADNPDLDISVTRFPGDVGGLLSNVNRWRSQIGLGPISAEALQSEIKQRKNDQFTFEIVSLHNSSTSQKTIVALLDYNGNTWFFKMSGPGSVVDKEENAFLAMVDSITREQV